MIDWTPLADLIEKYDRFLVTTHIRPDGDALGSAVGMAGLLRQKGKDVRVVNASRTPPRYDFLDPNNDLFELYPDQVTAADLADREVVVILDLSAWKQLGDVADLIRDFKGPRVVVDHHVSQDDLGAIFLTAIAMDTGWFSHPNTKPSTLRSIAELMEAGADVNGIYRDLFERNTLGRLKLMGETLSALKTEMDGRIVYTAISRDDLARTGAIAADSEDLVDFTVSLRGVEVGMLFIEQARGGVKASLRSRTGLDCAKLAGQLGGGGHRAAAGLTLPDDLPTSIERVLKIVRSALDPATASA
jgi:bifunctional oligoribonuclease and PAP phosphatase NrnA